MVTLTGTLTIKTITGRYGDFNVGNLDCELGKFSIRDAQIDEYNEGTYQGTFGLKRIYSGHYTARERLVIETRAELSGIWLDDYVEEALPEPDSIEEEPNVTAEARTSTSEKPTSETSQYADIFGELWPLGNQIGDIVKLTPEVGRSLMSQQLAYLKREVSGERLWRFEPKAQHWIRIRLDEEA